MEGKKKSNDYTIEIEGKTFIIQKAVWELIKNISIERDNLRMKLGKYERNKK